MPCLTGGILFMQQMYCKCQYIRFQMQRVGFAAEKNFSLCCFNGPTNEALNVQLEKQKPGLKLRPKNEIFKGLFKTKRQQLCHFS